MEGRVTLESLAANTAALKEQTQHIEHTTEEFNERAQGHGHEKKSKKEKKEKGKNAKSTSHSSTKPPQPTPTPKAPSINSHECNEEDEDKKLAKLREDAQKEMDKSQALADQVANNLPKVETLNQKVEATQESINANFKPVTEKQKSSRSFFSLFCCCGPRQKDPEKERLIKKRPG